MILNELVLNALKYAFPEGQAGEITIDFRCQGSDCVLTVQDNGIGLDATAPPQGTGLGLRMVRALTEQIGGVYEIAPGRNGGTIGTVRWPVIGGSPTG